MSFILLPGRAQLDRPEEAEGISLETLFFQEIKTVNESLGLGYSIYYWRTSNNMEVDFIK